MSKANAQIRFPNGDILFGLYLGTINEMSSGLYPMQGQAWQADEEGTERVLRTCDHAAAQEPVEIATDYGGGFTFTGYACRRCALLVTGHNPYLRPTRDITQSEKDSWSPIDDGRSPDNGLPDWWLTPRTSPRAAAV